MNQSIDTAVESIIETYFSLTRTFLDPQQLAIAKLAYIDLVEPLQETAEEYQRNLVQMEDADLADYEQDLIAQLLDYFYVETLFSVSSRELLVNPAQFDLSKVLFYRTGHELALTLMFKSLCETLGLTSELVISPQSSIIRIELSDDNIVFVSIDSGKTLTFEQVENMLHDEIESKAPIQMPVVTDKTLFEADARVGFQLAGEISDKDFVIRMLTIQMANLIQQEQFDSALQLCEVLLSEQPEDPYLRRDRGFLLQQINCEELAKADYQFFVEQCPDDPISKLIEFQIEELNPTYKVFH